MRTTFIYFSIIILMFQNCDEQITGPPTEEEMAEAQLLVDSANTLLFSELLNELEPDMSKIDSLYDKALMLDSNNKGAHFGKAFMEIALISQDEDLANAFISWSDCSLFNDLDLFPENLNNNPRSTINNAFQVKVPSSINDLLSFDPLLIVHYVPIVFSYEQVLNAHMTSCPDISDIQDLLENEFLSRISSAIAHLDYVLNSDYVFEITGEMMGDENQESLLLGDGEIYLYKAILHQARAMIYGVTTYDVDIPYYSDNPLEIIELLDQDSNFLTIRSGQENSLPKAHDDLNLVIDNIEYALLFNLQDSPNSSINDLEIDDLEEISDAINGFRLLLNEDINLCENDAECSMSLNISNFLNNPPQNMKKILPDYSFQMVTSEQNGYQYPEFSWGCFKLQ